MKSIYRPELRPIIGTLAHNRAYLTLEQAKQLAELFKSWK